MSNRPIQIGVIGTGGMGGRHIHNLATQVAGANIVAVMDIDEARLSDLQTKYNIAKTYTDALQLINDPEVQAVVIASPDKTHGRPYTRLPQSQ